MIDELVKPPKLGAPALLTFSTKVNQFNDRREQMTIERAVFLEEMRNIADHFRTRRGRFLLKDAGAKNKRSSVVHEHGIFASRILGAGMSSGVASAARPWLKLVTPDSDLNEFKSVKLWLDDTQRKLYRIFAGSNYYGRRTASFRDMGDFGQGPLLIDQSFNDVISAYVSPPGEYYLATDMRGRANTLYRDIEFTVMQMSKMFGRNMPREVLECYDRGSYEDKYTVVHVIEPNIRQIKGVPGPTGMPFLNLYYCLGVSDEDQNAVCLTSGYNELPFSCPYWEAQTPDPYGDGCGALAIGVCKSIQSTEKRRGQVVDKLAVPPTQAPASMEKKIINHRPGGNTYYPSNAMQNGGAGRFGPVSPLYQIDPQSLVAIGEETGRLETRIDRAYYVDLFFMLSQSDRRLITAREVEEKHEEKLIGLGPVLDNVHTDGLDVEVTRTFSIAARAGILKPPPKELDGIPLKAEYTSILAVAQRALGVSAIERFSGFIGNLAAGKPDVMDKWDTDQTIDEYADTLGVPAGMVMSDDEVKKAREARAQAEQQQAGMEQLTQGAQAAKVLSEADTSRDSNMLADILGGSVGRV